MQSMTPEEIRVFLVERPRTATLATIRADGRPHAAPIWFDLDGDEVVFMTWHASVKGTNLRRDGRVALSVDDETPPFAFALIEGHATLSDEPSERRRWAAQIAARYMGAARAEEFGARNGVPGELLVRVRPTRLVGRWGVAE